LVAGPNWQSFFASFCSQKEGLKKSSGLKKRSKKLW